MLKMQSYPINIHIILQSIVLVRYISDIFLS